MLFWVKCLLVNSESVLHFEKCFNVFQLKAKDMDCGSNAVVSYSFQDDVDAFKIGSGDGKICLDQQLDHETKDVHNVIVLATDRGEELHPATYC